MSVAKEEYVDQKVYSIIKDIVAKLKPKDKNRFMYRLEHERQFESSLVAIFNSAVRLVLLSEYEDDNNNCVLDFKKLTNSLKLQNLPDPDHKSFLDVCVYRLLPELSITEAVKTLPFTDDYLTLIVDNIIQSITDPEDVELFEEKIYETGFMFSAMLIVKKAIAYIQLTDLTQGQRQIVCTPFNTQYESHFYFVAIDALRDTFPEYIYFFGEISESVP